jgi:hypothetical protein
MAAIKFNTRFGLISALFAYLAETPVEEKNQRGFFEYGRVPFDATPAQFRAAFLHLKKAGALTEVQSGEDGIMYFLAPMFDSVARGNRLAAEGLIFFRGPMRGQLIP